MIRRSGFIAMGAVLGTLLLLLPALAREKAPTLRQLKAAVAERPNDPEAYYDLGVTYENMGKTREAIRAYQQALNLKPDFAPAYSGLGWSKVKQGNFDEAIKDLKKMVELKPASKEARAELGAAYNLQGQDLLKDKYRRADAIDAFKQAAKWSPDPSAAQNNLGVAYAATDRPEDAIAAFKDALGSDPKNPEAHYNLGTALLAQGKDHQAYAQYFDLKSLNPEYAGELSILIFEPERRSDYSPPEPARGYKPSPVMTEGQIISPYSTRRSW
jgi:tetratricopeptide (TPR) repeat protein